MIKFLIGLFSNTGWEVHGHSKLLAMELKLIL